jgi:spore coat polysaccharide biosynthesis predicted glycosyltransferase SpsG/RimJ/RimL family protein N-acetyltransferase
MFLHQTWKETDRAPDVIVVDHYGLDARFERAAVEAASQLRSAPLSRAPLRLLAIDDFPERLHACDILLDQSSLPDSFKAYVPLVQPTTRLCVGPEYAVLRPEFRSSFPPTFKSKVARAFVFFGSTDPGQFTLAFLKALSRQKERLPTQFRVLVTKHTCGLAEIYTLASTLTDVELVIDAVAMSPLMSDCDFAIGAAGTSLLERAALGLASILVVVAPNQHAFAKAYATLGAALLVDPAASLEEQCNDALQYARLLSRNQELRESLGSRARQQVKPTATLRIVPQLLWPRMTLRRALPSDCESLFAWRNSPQVRAASFQSTEISFESHASWFAKSLTNASRDLLIAEWDGIPVAVLRYDHSAPSEALPRGCVVSIYLTGLMALPGAGTMALLAGSHWMSVHRPECSFIDAEIKSTNVASLVAFERAGYAPLQGTFRSLLMPKPTTLEQGTTHD